MIIWLVDNGKMNDRETNTNGFCLVKYRFAESGKAGKQFSTLQPIDTRDDSAELYTVEL